MVVKAHKKFKQRRHKYRNIDDEEPQQEGEKQNPQLKQSVIDIFNFLSENEEDYSTVIHDIGSMAKIRIPEEKVNRSKSCSDILAIRNLDHSPSHKHMISISQVFMTANVAREEERPPQESNRDSEPPECARTADSMENKDSCASEPDNDGIFFTVPARDAAEDCISKTVQQAAGGDSRFKISKVNEDLVMDKDEKG